MSTEEEIRVNRERDTCACRQRRRYESIEEKIRVVRGGYTC